MKYLIGFLILFIVWWCVMWLNDLGKRRNRKTKCYCVCGHEILQDPNSKIYDAGKLYNIICANCDRQTTWDLDAPVPIRFDHLTLPKE